jgi:CheY-like chemotaxis protein
MDAATGAQIFEPFFTTKGAEGTGLGLSMVDGIISQSGGQIAVDSEPGRGTTFTITLPLAERVGALPEPVAATPASGGAETILLVEDDPVVKTVLTMMLDHHGYRLITAGSGEEALALARAAPDSVDLLITDLVMPGLNGRETAEAVRKHQPQAKVLYMSGYTDDTVIRVGHFEPGISFLQKPFSGDELAQRVRELLDSHAVDVCAVLSSQTPEFASSSSISLSSAPAI